MDINIESGLNGFLLILYCPLDIGFTTDFICDFTALDYLQQEIIRINPINPRSKKNSEVKRTRIERIERISFNLVLPTWYWIYYGFHLRYTALDSLQ